MAKKDMGSFLYDKLPEIYKSEDGRITPNPYPLKRFLSVFGVGLDFMKSKIDGHMNMYDPSTCPAEFLPLIAETFGFSFPHTLTELEQRRFVKMLPELYKIKGTDDSFIQLAQAIFGNDSSINIWRTQRAEGVPVSEWRTIHIEVEATNMQDTNRQTLLENFFKTYVNMLRPINKYLDVNVYFFYKENLNIRGNALEEISPDILSDLNADTRTATTLEIYDIIVLIHIEDETRSYDVNADENTEMATMTEDETPYIKNTAGDVDSHTVSLDDQLEAVTIKEASKPDYNGMTLNAFSYLNNSGCTVVGERYMDSIIYYNGKTRALSY
jgi:phage tail-like protein